MLCPAPPHCLIPSLSFCFPAGSCTQKNNSEVDSVPAGVYQGLGHWDGDSMRLLPCAFRSGGVREEPVFNLCSQA